MEHLKKVNAVKLWNHIIVDLDAISGFTSPDILRRDLPPSYIHHGSRCYFEFLIHTHPSTITIREDMEPGTLVVIDDSGKVNEYEGICTLPSSNNHEKTQMGWRQVDGSYTTHPNKDMASFQRFQAKFDELVKVWNNGRDVPWLADVAAGHTGLDVITEL